MSALVSAEIAASAAGFADQRIGGGGALAAAAVTARLLARLAFSTLVQVAVARTEAALPRAMATDNRCLSQAVSRCSPVQAEIRRPRSWTNAAAAGPYTPLANSATGTKMYRRARSAYGIACYPWLHALGRNPPLFFLRANSGALKKASLTQSGTWPASTMFARVVGRSQEGSQEAETALPRLAGDELAQLQRSDAVETAR